MKKTKIVTSSIWKSPVAAAEVLGRYEELVAAWPLPAETRGLPTRAGDTFVIVWGAESGPPLVLLHGTGSNSAMWMGDVARYGKNHRVYAIDIPGEPGKSEDRRMDIQGEAHAVWLEEVLDGLGLGSVRLVGLSLGGWIALSFAVTRPARVNKLGLLCPPGLAPTRGSFLVRAIALSFLGKKGMELISRSLYGNRVPPPGALEFGTLMASSYKPRMDRPRLFSDAELAKLTMPVFLVFGGRDLLLRSREGADRLARLVPHSRVLFDEGAGHALIDFGGQVAEFLEEPGAGTRGC